MDQSAHPEGAPKAPSTGFRQAKYEEPVLMEKPDEFSGCEWPAALKAIEDGHEAVPPKMRRKAAPRFPDLSEGTVVRHFTRLSQMNFGVDSGFYPLGSCTMKYNPKLCDQIAFHPRAADLHPMQDPSTVQGALRVVYELEQMLIEISGFPAVTLQPAAGAHGELTGLLLIRAYHEDREPGKRTQVIVPDSAHGTNPATAAMLGYEVIEIPSKDGTVDLAALDKALSDRTAAFMMTNPNTLGIFEPNILQIAKKVHKAGALLYYDGANFNAILGRCRPGDMGFDVCHFNLHKTLSVPHGGGGPGAGPVGVAKRLIPYLPVPVVKKVRRKYVLEYDRPKSIGKVRSYLGNFLALLRAYVYLRLNGGDGAQAMAELAVLNANYMRHQLTKDGAFECPFPGLRKHEFVLSGATLKARGVKTMDIAKRLLDYGYHAPTVYFPMLVQDSIMIEPTESESKETMDRFITVMKAIALEDPEILRSAPHNTAVRRVDEATAARKLVLSWRMRGA